MGSKKFFHLQRRHVIRGLIATASFGATSKLWAGCTPAEQSQSTSSTAGNSAAESLVIGFIYVGSKDDFGYNQAHFLGKEGISKIQGVKTVEEAGVKETKEVEETMRNMIEQDGAKVLFPTSFGYFNPYILRLAKEYPDVQFFHCGGLYQEGTHPNNVGSYFGYIDEAEYISGIVAALTSKTGKLGFIAAKPISQVLRNINSYTLGARSVKPDITTQVIFTGDWSLPVKEVEAANSLVGQNTDVITCHVDSPKVIMETAEKQGVFCTGYHANQAQLAPKGYLTGAEWDWTSIYTQYVQMLQAGKTLMNGGIPHLVRGGLKDGFLKLSNYGPAVSEQTKQAADTAKAKFMDNSMVVYKGEMKDNTGKVVIPTGKSYQQQDSELEKMNWLAAGVIGKVS